MMKLHPGAGILNHVLETRLLLSSDDSNNNSSGTLQEWTEIIVKQAPRSQSDHRNTPVTGSV
jgi:hypothetical protein